MAVRIDDRGRTGDLEGFARRFDVHRARLRRECLALLKDPDLAEDVVQETFLRAWRALDRFDESRPLRPWLSAIAKRLCLDHLRSHSSSRTTTVDPQAVDVLPAAAGRRDDAWRGARRSELGRALVRAVRRLSPRHRRLLYLAAVEGRSYAEIARACDTSETAVKSALCRARQRLRDEFRRMGEDGVLGVGGWRLSDQVRSAWRRLRTRFRALHVPVSAQAGVESQFGALFAAVTIAAASLVSGFAAEGDRSIDRDRRATLAADAASSNRLESDPTTAEAEAAPAGDNGELGVSAGTSAGSPGDGVSVAAGATLHSGDRPGVEVESDEQAGGEDGETELRVRLYCDRGSPARKAACETLRSHLDRLPADRGQTGE